MVLQLEVVAEDIRWSVGRVHGIRKGKQLKMYAWSCVPTATVMRMIDYLPYMAHQGIYRIAGNFREVQIFAIFATNDQNAKIRTVKYKTAKI